MKYVILILALTAVNAYADESTAGDLKEGKASRSVTCELGEVAVHITDTEGVGAVQLMIDFDRFGWRPALNKNQPIIFKGNVTERITMAGPTRFRLQPAPGVTAKYWLNCSTR